MSPQLRTAIALLGMLSSAQTHAELSFEPYAFETIEHGTHPAEVAFFTVPRRHANPSGPSFQLRVVRLAARQKQANATAIVYLAGGPGGSGVGTARGTRWPIFDQMRDQHDVLLFDQRGTGMSDVPVPCQSPPDPSALTLKDSIISAQNLALKCQAFWRAQNVDLGAYTTRESADDLAILQQLYGAQKIQLWGMSYGTHLAIATLRYHPDRIERAVLIGVEGPDDTLKLPLSADRMYARHAELLAADPNLRKQFPDLIATTRRLLASLRAQPAHATRWRPGDSREVLITEFSAQVAISVALGRRETARRVPLMVQLASQGDFDLLAEFVFAIDSGYQELPAMPLAMDLASGASAKRLAQIDVEGKQSLFGAALNFPFPDIGAKLELPMLDYDFRAPLQSNIPILMISGELDARTPPDNAENLAHGLSNYGHIRIANALHDDDLWLSNSDIAPILKAFFHGAPPKNQRLVAAVPDYATSITAEIWREAKGLIITVLGVAIGLMTLGLWLWRRRGARMARSKSVR